jgi:hypothetical protein
MPIEFGYNTPHVSSSIIQQLTGCDRHLTGGMHARDRPNACASRNHIPARQGRHGEVCQAKDQKLGRIVAIKKATEQQSERFQQEAILKAADIMATGANSE